MKAFLAGVAALVVTAVVAGFVYDWVAVDSAIGFRKSPDIHVHGG